MRTFPQGCRKEALKSLSAIVSNVEIHSPTSQEGSRSRCTGVSKRKTLNGRVSCLWSTHSVLGRQSFSGAGLATHQRGALM